LDKREDTPVYDVIIRFSTRRWICNCSVTMLYSGHM